ncbi:hypothetical protein [Actinomadura vinacea]
MSLVEAHKRRARVGPLMSRVPLRSHAGKSLCRVTTSLAGFA